MEKRSTFSIVWRVSLIPVGLALSDVIARLLWIWNPLYYPGIANSNPMTKPCTPTFLEDCSQYEAERTFENYNTDVAGWIGTHLYGVAFIALAVLLSSAIWFSIKLFYRWVVYQEITLKKNGSDLRISECSDPSCRCEDHVVNDEFNYKLHHWQRKAKPSKRTKVTTT